MLLSTECIRERNLTFPLCIKQGRYSWKAITWCWWLMIHPVQPTSVEMVKTAEEPRYLLTSSVFCTSIAILSTTRFCIGLLLCAVTIAESLPLASAGQMLDLPFGCSFQLWLCQSCALMLTRIRQQNARVLLSQLNLTFGCWCWVSSWPTWGTCACSGKEGNNFFFLYNIHSPSLSSDLKRNLNFSPSKFCDVCQSLLQVLSTSLLLWEALQKAPF